MHTSGAEANFKYVSSIVLGFQTRYSQLSELISTHYAGSNQTHLVIFVDVSSVINPLYKPGKLRYEFKNELATALINLCGFYREFFRRMDVITTFYLVYSLNFSDYQSDLVPGYNQGAINNHMMNKDVDIFVASNMRVLESMCPFLPRIYFVNGRDMHDRKDDPTCMETETSAIIYHLIKHRKTVLSDGKETAYMVLSKDSTMYQLIPYFDLKILHPMKRRNKDPMEMETEDCSYIVDKNNLWKVFMQKTNNCKNYPLDVGLNLFPNVYVLSSVKDRSLGNSIVTATKLLTYVRQAIFKGFLNNTDSFNQPIFNSALINGTGLLFNSLESENRFMAMNPKYLASFVLPRNNQNIVQWQETDMVDENSLKRLNEQKFEGKIQLDTL